MKLSIRFFTLAAIIAALYVALAMLFQPISFGPVQCRISEALTVLPIFTPAAIPGLFIGCLLSNLLVGGAMWVDIVFGSLATLIAAIATYYLRKNKLIAILPPVLVNALIVGTYLHILISPEIPLFVNMLLVLVGQIGSCYVLGYPLCLVLEKHRDRLF